MAKMITDGSLRVQNLSAVEVQRIEPLDILGLAIAAWRGKWLVMLTTILVVAAAGYYAFAVASPHYAATTTLKLDIAPSRHPGADMQLPAIGPDRMQINTDLAVLRSRHLLEKLVLDLDLQSNPEFNRYLADVDRYSLSALRSRLHDYLAGTQAQIPDTGAILIKTIENLEGMIAVGLVRDTYIFKITATTASADTSALIANRLAELYLLDQVEAKFTTTENNVEWLSGRVAELQAQLEAQETAINDKIGKQQLSDSSALDALSRQSLETGERLLAVQTALAEAESKLETLDVGTPGQIQTASDVLRFYDQVEALMTFQSGIETQIAAQSSGLVELQQLQREADATRVLYQTFLARLQETNIQRGLHQPDSRILALATPGTYVAPRKVFILLIAMLIGLTLGLGLVLGRHFLRRGYLDMETLAQDSGVPVFSQTPRLPIRKKARLIDYLNMKKNSEFAESIRNLRTSLLLSDPKKMPKVILSTSSIPGEGKTTLSLALCHNLAQLGKKALLIEADLRQPTFSKYLRKGASLGLANLTTEAITHHQALGADVLHAGKLEENPTDFFASSKFLGFLQSLISEYDFIIIDAPPVLSVPDARVLAQYSDTILFSVRWGKTDPRLVRAGQQALSSVHSDINGMILTRVNRRHATVAGEAGFAAYGQSYYQN